MQMSMTQPATGAGCREDIAASAQLADWVPACIRIGWVSGSRLTRECIADVVSRNYSTFQVTPFDAVSSCLKFSARHLDVIVYHCRGPDATDLQELTELRGAGTGVKIVVLADSVSIEPALVRKSLAEGTAGFILTSSNSLDTILSAIRLVTSGGTFVSREFCLAGGLAKRPRVGTDVHGMPQITQRERSVLERIKHGKSNKIIARELGLSVCTVKIHARNILQKMGVANRTEAAVKADVFLQPVPECESIRNHERPDSRWTDPVFGHHKWHCLSD